jgi:hypothetical protein
VEIESGLPPADRLIDNPLESIQTGDAVNAADSDASRVARERTSNAKAEPSGRPSL